jgi:hypothetical protein
MPEAHASVKQLHSSKEKISRWHLELELWLRAACQLQHKGLEFTEGTIE